MTTSLSEETILSDPIAQFAAWFDEAQNTPSIIDANAMCVSTVDPSGYPNGRMVLLKSFGDDGFVFFTNSTSVKGEGLKHLPRAALTFFWDPLRRQVRIQGDVSITSEAESDDYFQSRARRSQLGAWASQQSKPLESRKTLENKVLELEETYSGQTVPRPPHWHGYRVRPHRIEFWQEQPNRLHDRFLFTLRDTGEWVRRRLYP